MIRRTHTSRRAFTLVELLIVLAIIGLLAAILFPVFRSAKERGYQTHCASNLMQIYQAVQLYRQDEKYYPSSLGFLLPVEIDLDGGVNTNGTGYFKGGRDGLLCSDDDSDTSTTRSSYGDISWNGPPTSPAVADMGRYIWNYWGYRGTDGTCSATDASGCAGTAFQSPTEALAAIGGTGFNTALLLNPASPPTTAAELKKNPLKYSLSNRFAPTTTIITHCVYHRLPTAKGKLSDPFEVYSNAANGAGARDLVLRLDGTTKLLDISTFNSNGNWDKQNF